MKARRASERSKPKPPGASAGRMAGIDPGVTETVVLGALLGVREDLVGLRRLLERLLRLLAARVAVGVMLQGQLPVGLLDLFDRSAPVNPEHFVVIAFGHRLRLAFMLPARPFHRRAGGCCPSP